MHYHWLICLRKNYKTKKFVIIVKNYKTKNRVIEKLGSYDVINKKLTLNPFRLIFFIGKNASLSGSLFSVLYRFKILQDSQLEKLIVFKRDYEDY